MNKNCDYLANYAITFDFSLTNKGRDLVKNFDHIWLSVNLVLAT